MTTNRISFRLVGVVVVLLLLVAACQEVNRIGVANQCQERVEVRDVTLEDDSMKWVPIEPGNYAEVVGVSSSEERLILAVRTESIPAMRVFDLSVSSLSEPWSGDAEYDTEVVLGGVPCLPVSL